MKIIQNFFVLEGLDGSGTTTQLELLKDKTFNLPVWTTFEPTNSEVGLLLRRALRKEISLPPTTLVHLFAADRDIHVQEISEKACERIVVCDRYISSSYAYQSLSCSWDLIMRVNEDFPLPQDLLFLEVSPQICAQRRAARGAAQELFEEVELQVQIDQNYRKALAEAEKRGCRVHILDGTRAKEVVHKEICKILSL